MARSSSAASGMAFQPSGPKLKVTTVCIAWPSSDGKGPWISPSTPFTVANSCTSSLAAAMSASVSPDVRS